MQMVQLRCLGVSMTTLERSLEALRDWLHST